MNISRVKNRNGENVNLLVKVTTRPNLRDGTHEMFLYSGKHFIDNIFDKKIVDEETTEVFMYYPETWANIPELQNLISFILYFYPNVKKIDITTHSVYVIQTAHSENIRIYDKHEEYPQTSDPMKRLSPLPDIFEGLWANGKKVAKEKDEHIAELIIEQNNTISEIKRLEHKLSTEKIKK